jgi:zinc transport system substrate-binding protein
MKYFLLIISLINIATPAMAANVVVSIKPIHSLVAMIMENSGNAPSLLVDGTQSLHSFSLKPSQIQNIQKADIVFYISDELESFLSKTLANSPASKKRIALAKQPNIVLLPVRQNDGFERHHHDEVEHDEHDEHDEHESSTDYHLWSSPENAKTILRIITQNLIAINPAQKALYSANQDKAIAAIDTLDISIKKQLLPLQNHPFITFHDATQYFEKAYGLTSVGTLTLHPERGTSAKHIQAIRAKIADRQANCVFHEPQFDTQITEKLLAKTNIKSHVIDPEAALIQPSTDLYIEMLKSLTQSFKDCLS